MTSVDFSWSRMFFVLRMPFVEISNTNSIHADSIFAWFAFYPIADFEEILNEFDNVIETAAFFSIDSEFTGLFSERTMPFSTPSEFYRKLHGGTDDFIIVQLGITAFSLSEGNYLTHSHQQNNFAHFSDFFSTFFNKSIALFHLSLSTSTKQTNMTHSNIAATIFMCILKIVIKCSNVRVRASVFWPNKNSISINCSVAVCHAAHKM